MVVWVKERNVLPETPRSEKLSNDVNSLVLIIDPRVVEPDDITVLQRFQKTHFRVEPLQGVRRLQDIIYSDLIPRDLNPINFIEGLVTGISSS